MVAQATVHLSDTIVIEGGGCRPGSQIQHPDSRAIQLSIKCFAKALHTGFGRAVTGVARKTDRPEGRTDIEDNTRTL